MSDGRPVYTKDNEMTRLIAEVEARNRQRGSAIARGQRPMELVAPRVTTAAMQMAPGGVLPPVVMGDPTGQPNLGMIEPNVGPSYAQMRPVERGGLPDFTKIEAILLGERVMIVDGMRFDIPTEDYHEIKVYVIQAVTNAITQRVAAAFAAIKKEADAALQKAMQPLSAQPADGQIHTESDEEGPAASRVQNVPEGAGQGASPDAVRAVKKLVKAVADALGEPDQPLSNLRDSGVVVATDALPSVRGTRRKRATVNRPSGPRRQSKP